MLHAGIVEVRVAHLVGSHRSPRVALLALSVLLGVSACAQAPAVQDRVAPDDAWIAPGTQYNAQLDGGGLDISLTLQDVGAWTPPDAAGDAGGDVPALPDVPVVDVPLADGQVADVAQPDVALQDTPMQDAPLQDVPVQDVATTDIQTTDTTSGDTTTDAGTWPSGSLTVQSAFSPDGKNVKVRFNKPVDPTTVTTAKSFTITGSDNSTLTVLKSEAAADPQFVSLTLDPNQAVNPALTYTVLVKSIKAFDAQSISTSKNKATIKRTVYVSILWHQHQPTYLDPIADQLTSPWVRKHATKDYYDMAAILQNYPDVHVNINITPVMLNQMIPYYIDRLAPYVDTKKNTVDAAGFLAKWKGHTDPWIDLLLEPTPDPATATPKQLGLLYADPWSCVSTAPVLMNRFPAYAALRDKNPATLTKDDFLALKIWFELAWFDPDFLHGPVTLPTGDVVDLTDILSASAPTNATFTLKVPMSEQLANRIVAEEVKIIKAIIPIHKKLFYDAALHTGQIEIATTPFYHPILPLVHDTELEGYGQPFDPKPAPPYQHPEDAAAQVGRAVAYYTSIFGQPPRGMWPGEGSVAEAVVQHFRKFNIEWVATDQAVLAASKGYKPGGAPADTGAAPQGPWRVDTDTSVGAVGDPAQAMAVFFRNTNMSNDIGFKYQGMVGTDAADDLIKNVAAQAPTFGAPDRVITLVLDGENAWETFSKEHDGKGFFIALYSRLTQSQAAGEIISVTGSEYLLGNPARNVPAHPLTGLNEVEPLFPGSWIGGNFAIWIGESEENTAWGYLRTARQDLVTSGLTQPDPTTPEPADHTSLGWHVWKAFDEIYAAEGSDWFWWYGSDMTSPSNDDSPFDASFRTHLAGMYAQMNAALQLQGKPAMTLPDFKPIIQANPQAPQGPLVPPPTLDGVFTPNEGEWSTTGGFFFDSDTSGALANPDDWMATIYYGFGTYQGKDGLFLGVQHNFDLSLATGALGVYFSQKHIVDAATGTTQEDPATMSDRLGDVLTWKGKGAARELWIPIAGGKATPEWRKSDGTANWAGLAASTFGGSVAGPVKGGKLMEIFIPYTDLGIVAGDPLEMQLVFSTGGKMADLAPSLESKVVVDDPTLAVFVTFTCDVSEKSIAINTYGDITNPPPPKGKGIVYIAGNDPKLGMKTKWNPNKVALRDDGAGGDVTAGDNIWTLVLPFSKGTSLKYKYTLGLPSNEGQWAGTEEFPLTERGVDITKDPAKKKVKIADIFADRPSPSGTKGPGTVITEQ